ncbi:MAG TPA: hypothetical protein VF801_05160 [Rhodocyclaceae bacterium]
MAKSLKLALVVLTFFCHQSYAGLLGSGGRDDDCANDHSLAWCVLDYLGASTGIKDTDALSGKYAAMERTDLDKVASAAGAVVGVGQMAKVAFVPPGVSPSVGGLLTVLTAFADSTGPADKNHILVLMPEQEVQGDPMEHLIEVFGKAGVAAFQAESYEVRVETKKPLLAPATTERTLFFVGGACKEKRCEISTSVFRSGGYSGELFERVSATPKYLGGNTVYQWASSNWSYFPRVKINGLISHEVAIRLAGLLPPWVYMHFARGQGLPDPFVIGQGKVHWFLKPGVRAPSLAGLSQ